MTETRQTNYLSHIPICVTVSRFERETPNRGNLHTCDKLRVFEFHAEHIENLRVGNPRQVVTGFAGSTSKDSTATPVTEKSA